MENVETNTVPGTGQQGEPDHTPAQEEKEKTFTQDDVNRIVQERLSRERERINSIINEDESVRKELATEKLKLKATRELTEKGFPVELVDFMDCTDENTYKQSLEKVCSVFDKLYKRELEKVFRSSGRTPESGTNVSGNTGDALRDAFRP